mgnify:FL=1
MRKIIFLLIIVFVAFGIFTLIQSFLNNKTELKISDAIHKIDNKSKSKDSLQVAINLSNNVRFEFASKFGDNPKIWENLESTLTFPNARKSVYYRLDQEFVEMCKRLGHKDSESFFDYITEHSIDVEGERKFQIEQLSSDITNTIETKQRLQTEIIKFSSVIKWTMIFILLIIVVLFIKKVTIRSKS